MEKPKGVVPICDSSHHGNLGRWYLDYVSHMSAVGEVAQLKHETNIFKVEE